MDAETLKQKVTDIGNNVTTMKFRKGKVNRKIVLARVARELYNITYYINRGNLKIAELLVNEIESFINSVKAIDCEVKLSSSSTGKPHSVKEERFLYYAKVNAPYGGGMILVVAKTKEEAKQALMDYNDYIYYKYEDSEFVKIDNVTINVDKPYVVAESSYVE